jgi:AraC-like DNA-binding protein
VGLALSIARNLVAFLKRPGGQAQFSAALLLQPADDRFADLHSWLSRLAEHLADHLSLSRLAARAGMSERSFQHRYREATGMAPAPAVERLRIEAARRLLVETWRPACRPSRLRRVVGSEETMGRSFARRLIEYSANLLRPFARDLVPPPTIQRKQSLRLDYLPVVRIATTWAEAWASIRMAMMRAKRSRAKREEVG